MPRQDLAAMDGLVSNRSLFWTERLAIARQLIDKLWEEIRITEAKIEGLEVHLQASNLMVRSHMSLECRRKAHADCDDSAVCGHDCWCDCHLTG